MRINLRDERFQLGRTMYEAQLLYAAAEHDDPINNEQIMEVAAKLCECIHTIGELRGELGSIYRTNDQLKEELNENETNRHGH